jgi:hypothetical protein
MIAPPEPLPNDVAALRAMPVTASAEHGASSRVPQDQGTTMEAEFDSGL